ncbi:retrovirus-related pol polyprotein from transposon TNT 1-94 [Tanacetum coccineum]
MRLMRFVLQDIALVANTYNAPSYAPAYDKYNAPNPYNNLAPWMVESHYKEFGDDISGKLCEEYENYYCNEELYGDYDGVNVVKVIKCYNCKGIGHYARQFTQKKWVMGSILFKEKMLLARKEEVGSSDTGNDERQHFEQPACVNETYVEETNDSNIILDTLDMNVNGDEDAQHGISLDQENVVIMALIGNMQREVERSNMISKETKKTNELLTMELERYKKKSNFSRNKKNMQSR